MHFKLIIALVDEASTTDIMKAAREAGATGATVVGDARGEGLEPTKTFFGMNLESRRDMLMFLVEEHLSRQVLERVAISGGFDETPGRGLALQIDVEDTIGMKTQMEAIVEEVEEEI